MSERCGAAIGIWRARVVEMTGMPELIAMMHSFVGLAAVLVGWNSSYETDVPYPGIHDGEVFVMLWIRTGASPPTVTT